MIQINGFKDTECEFITIKETHCFDDSIPKIHELIKQLGLTVLDWEIQHVNNNMEEYYRKSNNGPNWDEALINYPVNNGKTYLHGNLKLELLCIRGNRLARMGMNLSELMRAF